MRNSDESQLESVGSSRRVRVKGKEREKEVDGRVSLGKMSA